MNCSCGVAISKHPAMHCLDAMIAERVMKWVSLPSYNYWMTLYPGGTFDLHNLIMSWSPSSDIAAAWQIVEKLELSYCVRLRSVRDKSTNKWYCGMDTKQETFEAWAETAPLAIVRTALITVASTPQRLNANSIVLTIHSYEHHRRHSTRL